jgi:hypothetical protein
MPRNPGWLIAAACVLLTLSSPASAQHFAPLHSTLAAWEDALWLDLLDRNYSIGGRHSDLGVLKRWYDVDWKYHLDVYFLEPNLADDYAFTTSPNGFQWHSGSLTPRDLAASGVFKTRVGLGKKWGFAARFDLLSLPRVRRGAFRANIEYAPQDQFGLALKIHLDPQKPGTDLGLGFSWKPRIGVVNVEFWMMDALNDLVYQTLEAARQPQIDLTEDYQKQPFGLKANFDLEPVKDLRFEGYGAVITSSSIHVFHPAKPDAGFLNSEDIWYAGGMVEWRVRSNWLISVFGSNVSAASGKAWDSGAIDETDYELSERTTRAGAATIFRPGSHWEFELRGEHNWRPEERFEPVSGDTLEHYRLESWLSRLNIRYQSTRGFFTDLRFGFNDNQEPLGSGNVPTVLPLETVTYRIGLELGWRFGKNVYIAGGAARDIGNTPAGSGFGGARGRGVVMW